MITKAIADRLIELCRLGDFKTAQKELFSLDAVSIEPSATPEFDKETTGLDAILQKGEKFDEMVEKMHKITVSDPLVAGNSFAMTIEMNATMKEKGDINMTELCVYNLKDGKIVSEEFFM